MEENTNVNVIEEVIENTEILEPNKVMNNAVIAGGLLAGFAIGYAGVCIFNKLIKPRLNKNKEVEIIEEVEEVEEEE